MVQTYRFHSQMIVPMPSACLFVLDLSCSRYSVLVSRTLLVANQSINNCRIFPVMDDINLLVHSAVMEKAFIIHGRSYFPNIIMCHYIKNKSTWYGGSLTYSPSHSKWQYSAHKYISYTSQSF